MGNTNRKLGMSKGSDCRNIEMKKVKVVNGWYSLGDIRRSQPNFLTLSFFWRRMFISAFYIYRFPFIYLF